jgi:energy-converting hydrogenase Eha subunit A
MPLSRLPRCSFAAVVIGLLLLGRPVNCVAQQKPVTASEHETSYIYDTPGINLEGTLIQRKVFGPPGYGETDANDSY